MAQHVRVHRRRETSQQAAALQALPDRLRRQACAAPADEQRHGRITLARHLVAHGQPALQRRQRLSAQRHAAPLAALALHLHFGRRQVDPATPAALRGVAGRHVQADQFAHAQAAAVEQLDHGGVARFQPRVIAFGHVIGQLHRFVDAQRLGQRARLPGCAHVLHRVGADQAFAPEPGVEAAPAREDERNAAPAAPAGVHLRHPAAHVVVLHRRQRHTGLRGGGGELVQVFAVQRQRARRQAFLHPRVLQVALGQRGLGGVNGGWLCSHAISMIAARACPASASGSNH